MSEMVKCLVWDLDNTLWKGTLLEGDEVTLDEEIRHVIQTLDGRGILQSISSKNDPDLAEARLAELGIAEYFVCPHIGWEPKSQAIRAIAEELNFALTAMAFVDDQPAERAEVMYHVPDVRCYSADEIATLVELPEFNPLNVTEDASRRRVMYQAAARRDAARSDFTGPDEDFLRSLELAMRIQRADENQLARVQELTLRTSQMNATGVHYSDTVLRQLVNQEEHEVLVASLTDRFGTHGAIGVVLLEKHSQVWHLKLLATSCRVVSFGAGSVILRWLINQSDRGGVHLVADFRRTSRNRIMEVTYRLSGFTEDECACYTGLPAIPDIDGLQRLHLVPAPQVNPLTMTLTAPDLSER